MKKTLKNGTRVVTLPGVIVVYNFKKGDDPELSQIVSANPCEPTVFISSSYDRAVFSQAENSVRTFIFLRGAIDESAVDPAYPAQWVSPGDFIPAVPGNVSVEATETGFKVTTLGPESTETVTF